MAGMTVEIPHRWRDRDGLYQDGPPIQVPVLWIEYRRLACGRLVPFGVQTVHDSWSVEWCKRDQTCYYHDVGSGLWMPWREFNNGVVTEYRGRGKDKVGTTDRPGQAVEYFGRGMLSPGRFADPKKSAGPCWYDRERVTICLNTTLGLHDGKRTAKDQDGYLRKCGYVPLAEPPEIEPGVVNPFLTDGYRAYGDNPTFYCCVCDDWLPTGDGDVLCDHVEWCETHGWWKGRGAKNDGCCGFRKRRTA